MTAEQGVRGGLPEVPSRVVLTRAERQNAELGHELDGFLSAAAGFVPRYGTVTSFPASHSAWDEVVDRMPELWRTVTLRQVLREMPVLSARREDLPDAYVWRASSVLSVFAHAFVRIEVLPSDGLPPSVTVPWAQVSDRLGRREPHMSYNDLIVYNHRLRDRSAPNPYTIDNMDLLVPSVDNREERRFYLAQVEILARSTPVVDAVVRAQEAVVRDDRDALAAELGLILKTWRDITEISFRKVDPNPLSDTYVDQVVWANTVAPLAVPIKSGTAGPGGEASPVFHLMDAFLGRRHKQSLLGKEVAELREWFPRHHIDFIQAVEEISVRSYVANSGDRRLQNLFATLFDAYAGKRGYLGVHRMKVYGFLELAFKVGRSKTITGIVGGFREKHWKTLDAILEETRLERHRELPPYVQYAHVRSRAAAAPAGEVSHVVLDAEDTGVVYRPGDRCGVLPTNPAASVDALLTLFGSSGDEAVPLTAEWREAVRYRGTQAATLPLRTFLSFAKIRPLSRDTAVALAEVSGSQQLRALVERHEVEQWELVDALAVLAAGGYPLGRLLTAEPGDPEALAEIVAPESFRMYSVSSAPGSGDGRPVDGLRLTVARLSYPAGGPRPVAELSGTASTQLTSAQPTSARSASDRSVSTEATAPLPFHIVRPSRFALPRDSTRPVVMFAGGVGIAPFLSFLAARDAEPAAGRSWLFLGTKDRDHFYGESEVAAAIAGGRLRVEVAFSRADGGLRADFGESLRPVARPSGHADTMIRDDPDLSELLWDLLRADRDGGQGAYFYVCGRTEFARGVMSLISAVAARFSERPELCLRGLVAEGRFMHDVFTTWKPPNPGQERTYFDTSEIALRTTPETGQWMIINGEVFDVTEFLHLHPGGPRIITENVGLDATGEYEAVLHHESSEIAAMLAMYHIGTVRRLDLDDQSSPAPDPRPEQPHLALRDLYRCWVRLMHLVTEMSNALANDWAFMTGALTRGDDPDGLNALKVQYASNAHQRFLGSYFAPILDEELPHLGAVTTACCPRVRRLPGLPATIQAALATPDAVAADRFSAEFRTAYRAVSGVADAVDPALWSRLAEVCQLVQAADRAFLADVRMAVREGVMVFERLEARTALDGGENLADALGRIAGIVNDYHRTLLTGMGAMSVNSKIW